MKNFEKAKKEGREVLTKHPRIDLHASEIKTLMSQYEGRSLYDVITDMFLVGLSSGYKVGKADQQKIAVKEGK